MSNKTVGAGKSGNYSIFDSPGSDRFHFGDSYRDQSSSAHGSIVSLEWDSQGTNYVTLMFSLLLYGHPTNVSWHKIIKFVKKYHVTD